MHAVCRGRYAECPQDVGLPLHYVKDDDLEKMPASALGLRRTMKSARNSATTGARTISTDYGIELEGSLSLGGK
jgi:hypothetical protein